MNARERFKAICNFERPNDFFTFGLWAWNEAWDRWLEEGLPIKKDADGNLYKQANMHFFGYQNENEAIAPNGCIMGLGKNFNPDWVAPLSPLFEEKTVKEDDVYREYIQADGALVRVKKDVIHTIPEYLSYPVTDKKSWDEYKKRLDPHTPDRFPPDWDKMVDERMFWPCRPELEGKSWEQRDFPLGMFAYSLCGMPRNHLGLEDFCVAIFEDIDFVCEMLDWQTYLAEELLKKVFAAGVTLDWVWVWEDIAYNTGPLVNPQFVKEFMIPRYRKITDLLHANGVSAIIVDCDGNLDELMPLWVDAGINATYPMEQAAGNDPRDMRKKFGKNLTLFGGIDKRALAKGKKEIDAEIAKAKELMAMGGFFPGCDHHVPPDVSYENIRYFLNELYKLSDYPELRRTVV